MTHDQFAELLLRRLQIYFSCSDSAYRAYLVNFFGSIFNDPSVILNESSYVRFVTLMDEELDYCAKNNIYDLEAAYNNSRFNTQWSLLEAAFAEIGVGMTMKKNSDGPTSITFTLPSGETRVWDDLQSNEKYLRINAQLRVTDDYLAQMMPYYIIDDHVVTYSLRGLETNIAGHGTYWDWDADTGTMTISGDGSLAAASLWSLLDIAPDSIETFIIGAGVNRICADALNFAVLLDAAMDDPITVTIIDLHGSNDDILLEDQFYPDTTMQNMIIYSDNKKLRAAVDVVVGRAEWHSLDEWTE